MKGSTIASEIDEEYKLRKYYENKAKKKSKNINKEEKNYVSKSN